MYLSAASLVGNGPTNMKPRGNVPRIARYMSVLDLFHHLAHTEGKVMHESSTSLAAIDSRSTDGGSFDF